MQGNTPFQGNKAMMPATCTEITFSIWLHNKWKVVCMQATVMATGSAFRRERLLNSSRTHRQGSAGASILHMPHSTSGNGNASELYFGKMKEAGQVCSGTPVAASNIQQKNARLCLMFYHKTQQWPILKSISFSYFPCMQQIDSGCTFQKWSYLQGDYVARKTLSKC